MGEVHTEERTVHETPYNSRLFGPGLYGAHHTARFQWLRRELKALNLKNGSVLELGCFDAKSVDWIPFEITRYAGIDAGWESGEKDGEPTGLAAAVRRFGQDPRFTFKASIDPNEIHAMEGTFDVGICMETFEHVPSDKLEAYVAAMGQKVKGTMVVSVPNEKGPALLFKTMAAAMLRRDRDIPYKRGEWFNSVLCRMHRVEHKDHKGFDYVHLRHILARHFRNVRMAKIGPAFLPIPCQLTVGMVAEN